LETDPFLSQATAGVLSQSVARVRSRQSARKSDDVLVTEDAGELQSEFVIEPFGFAKLTRELWIW
jgi:hypothetical protein